MTKNYVSASEIKVGLNFGADTIPVGRLAMREHTIYFEYDTGFIDKGLNISPFRLPLKTGVSTFDRSLFEGLPGVFNDSLPDGWGRLLFDRFVRSQGVLPADITPLDRLAHIGANGMGALVYEPDHSGDDISGDVHLDDLAMQVQDVLDGEAEDVLQELLALNGSSAGARPKALIGVDKNRAHICHGANTLPDDYEHWLVKFPNTQDGVDAGTIEYVYSLIAKDAGVDMPETRLFPSKNGAGYFAIKRFDRDDNKRFHMHTACGLLHSDFRTPSLDYEDLIALTTNLTRDVREAAKMFRQAVFNVLSHNRDDHSKNFSFLMDHTGRWSLSPTYDVTFSSGPGGEQSTTVMGEGRAPTTDHLIKLGIESGMDKKEVNEIIDQTKAALSQWRSLAKKYGVSSSNIDLIEKKIVTG